MAATEKKQMWQWSGPAPQIVERPIAASQGIYMAGAPCYVSQSGTVKLSDTSDGNGDVIHGFICEGVTAELAANTLIKIALIDLDSVYAVFVENNASDTASTQAMVGDQYGLRVSTTAGQIGYTTMDINNSNATVQVFDVPWNISSQYAAADSPGVALVKFLNANVNASKA